MESHNSVFFRCSFTVYLNQERKKKFINKNVKFIFFLTYFVRSSLYALSNILFAHSS